jgi:hypothetical protein
MAVRVRIAIRIHYTRVVHEVASLVNAEASASVIAAVPMVTAVDVGLLKLTDIAALVVFTAWSEKVKLLALACKGSDNLTMNGSQHAEKYWLVPHWA